MQWGGEATAYPALGGISQLEGSPPHWTLPCIRFFPGKRGAPIGEGAGPGQAGSARTHKGRHSRPLVTGGNDRKGHNDEDNGSADAAKEVLFGGGEKRSATAELGGKRPRRSAPESAWWADAATLTIQRPTGPVPCQLRQTPLEEELLHRRLLWCYPFRVAGRHFLQDGQHIFARYGTKFWFPPFKKLFCTS